MGVLKPEKKLDVFEITAQPVIVDAPEESADDQAARIAAATPTEPENVDHNVANRVEEEPEEPEEPEELEEWNC